MEILDQIEEIKSLLRYMTREEVIKAKKKIKSLVDELISTL